ncbi:MAG: TonB family protein [Candidatus Angelobacter sp.]|jgi:TonB family protein|nr:TonB family protein [Candidatus Angelobacter sp.]
MKRVLWPFVIGCALSAAAVAQEHKISVQKFEPPVYPQIAKQARITGEVKLALEVAADGSVTGVKVLSGHPMLVPAALNNVKLWKFHCDDCGYGLSFQHALIYRFHLKPVTGNARCVSGIGLGSPVACYLLPDNVELFIEEPTENVIRDPAGEPLHSWLWRLFHRGKKTHIHAYL